MLITLFSDASMCHKRNIGGWAAWLKCDRHSDPFKAGGAFNVQVNDSSMAESMAVVNALAAAIKADFVQSHDTVLIQTDNNSVLGVLEGTVRRKMSKVARVRKGLSRSQAKALISKRNAEIDAVSTAFKSLVSKRNLTIRWRHVKGHQGNIDPRSAVNTYCDKVARFHMRSARGKHVTTISERIAKNQPQPALVSQNSHLRAAETAHT